MVIGSALVKKIEIKDIKINLGISDDLFEPPASMNPSAYPPPFVPQKLADGIFFVPLFNGTGISWNSLVTVHEDYVIVYDAPLSDLLIKFYIRLIKRVAPGKPIKYVVPTHHHSDHLGGIVRMIAEGATVVTTPGNVDYIKHISSVNRTIKENPNGLDADNISFEIFTERKIIDGEGLRVELYNVGPNPHADEIIVAYFPETKILYVTDMYFGYLEDHYPPAWTALVSLDKKLQELGLDIKTIAPGHGKVVSFDQFNKALGKTGKNK